MRPIGAFLQSGGGQRRPDLRQGVT